MSARKMTAQKTAAKKTSPKKTTQRAAAEVDSRFVPVVDAFAADRHVSGGTMMSSYGLKVHGKIFAMCVRGKFVAKLPRERVDEIVSGGKGERFDPGHGRLMKEWVEVAAGRADWVELAREAYRFVKGESLNEA